MTDWDVSGWEPAWQRGQSGVEAHREGLLSLRGHAITNSWIIWNLDDDEWFADGPVVIGFDDGRHLEVCWQKFDDISISWNTIDPSHQPAASVTWSMQWRSQAHPALAAIGGETVLERCNQPAARW